VPCNSPIPTNLPEEYRRILPSGSPRFLPKRCPCAIRCNSVASSSNAGSLAACNPRAEWLHLVAVRPSVPIGASIGSLQLEMPDRGTTQGYQMPATAQGLSDVFAQGAHISSFAATHDEIQVIFLVGAPCASSWMNTSRKARSTVSPLRIYSYSGLP
jgi:hypothetical protein